MAKSPVIYEVTLDVDTSVTAEMDAWLKTHVHDMLLLPGFIDAKILRPKTRATSTDGNISIRRVVRYRLACRTDLEKYFQEHAARMRAETQTRFGENLRSSRRVLDKNGQELIDIDISSSPGITEADLILTCLNCGEPLTGKYCANCGQQNHTYAAPLWGVINDFFGNHFGFDTKFFHSILPLLFRPGFLSLEYSAGRRVRYINPLRLYFFSSLLFFFVAWSFANPQFMRFNDSGNSAKSKPELSQAQHRENENNQFPSAQHHVQSNSNSQDASSNDDVNFTMFGRPVHMSKSEFTARMTRAFEASLPKLMFVFLPLVALLLKLFYIRSKRYYMEHLVFTLHNHAFVFIAMLLMVSANILAKHVVWTAEVVRYFNDIVGWYMAIYIYFAMRVYYRQSYLKTFFKYLLIGFIYWLTMLVTFIAGMVLILTELTAA